MIKNKFLNNLSYLAIIQILTLVIPFVYYPYLIRYMGADNYGFIIYVQSIVLILSVFVDFGFNLYGTKEISINRECDKTINKIYTCILIIKIIISILLLPVFLLILQYTVQYNYNGNTDTPKILYLIILNDVLFSQWFFQGFEKIKYAAGINLISRLLLLLIIYIGSKTSLGLDSFCYALIFAAITNAFLSVIIIRYKFNVKIVKVKFVDIKYYFHNAIHFMYSRVINIIILKINSFIIGNFLGMNYVAYYDLAEKLVNLLTMPLNILNQVTYPKVAKDKNYNFVYKMIKISLLYGVVIYLIAIIFGKDVISLFAGPEMNPSYYILIILSLSIPINAASYFLGNCILITSGNISSFNKSITYPSIIYLLIIFLLYILGAISEVTLSVTVVLNCILVCLYRIYSCFHLKNN